MDATLKALAALAVQAIPTVLFFIFLTHYLKRVYFLPVGKILEERRRQTEGVRELAEQAHKAADQKSSEFETAIQLARSQIMQENDVLRRQWAEEQGKSLAEARAAADRDLAAAKTAIAGELESAKSDVGASIEDLSSRIIESLSRRRAA